MRRFVFILRFVRVLVLWTLLLGCAWLCFTRKPRSLPQHRVSTCCVCFLVRYQGDWVLSASYEEVVGGERLAAPMPSAQPRHELFMLTGQQPEVGQELPQSPRDMLDVNRHCPAVITECLFLQLTLCPDHPDYMVESCRLL